MCLDLESGYMVRCHQCTWNSAALTAAVKLTSVNVVQGGGHGMKTHHPRLTLPHSEAAPCQ